MSTCEEFAGLALSRLALSRPALSRLALSRRAVLRGLAAGGVATTIGSAVVTTAGAASAAAGPATSVLVVLSLRGAADGLSLVVPHGDPVYYAARPHIAVPRSSLLAADGFFGLHPALAPLLPLWRGGEVAAVHATGMAVPNRSHFEAMELVEDADPGSTVRSGWLNRLVGLTSSGDPLQGLTLGATTPTSMVGTTPTMSIADLRSASVPGDSPDDDSHRRALSAMWRDEDTAMGRAMRDALAGVDRLGAARAQADRASTYPATDLGRALASVARTLRADLGVQVVTVDQGDWDMHADLGTLDWGGMRSNAAELAQALAAFFADLGDVRSKVTLVALSEFGRRVVENSGYGLDHGWGNVMLVLGAGVRGGYYSRWTPLANTLDADLTVTTDYRDVLAEVVAARLPATSLARVFPGFARRPIGFMAGQSGWGRSATPTAPLPGPTPTTGPAPGPTGGAGGGSDSDARARRRRRRARRRRLRAQQRRRRQRRR